ncbi:hypothetical protein GRI89_09850 [Altererythrobacter salegens]|uniref:Uncharacterized protein n=1 Tax=Croceibacterium salegens TaxID=1737568 RepID=A0A6I4SZU1_9SPHN|nr:hypothetical protein [Croceibacterium salegens]MXO59842.1 hypothetical protein [Croceibacterium salegens]
MAALVAFAHERDLTSHSDVSDGAEINRRGIGVAEPYREYLEPFVRAYRA